MVPTIVLLGSEEAPDTVLGNPRAGEKDIKGLSVYLNSRFLGSQQDQSNGRRISERAQDLMAERTERRDDARRPNNRQDYGR